MAAGGVVDRAAVLAETLPQTGIITARTKPLRAFWVDMQELEVENHEVAGMAIAEDGVSHLKELNAGRMKSSSLEARVPIG